MFVWSAVSKEEWNANQMANSLGALCGEVFTDGMGEAFSAAMEGGDGVSGGADGKCQWNRSSGGRIQNTKGLVEAENRDVKEFLKGELPKQDITMLLLRYLGT